MPRLNIDVETPETFGDIDFGKIANYYGDAVDVVADLEGAALPWSYGTRHAEIGVDVIDAIAHGITDETVVGAHAMTNRAGAGGRALTTLFTNAVNHISPLTASLGEYPRSRGERKPSGTLIVRLIDRLCADEALWTDPDRRKSSRLVVAVVGDKLSDMLEAQALHLRRGIIVVGFMVQRHGNTDHPLDTVFGVRKKATAARQELQAIAPNRFLKTKV